ncbi:MAG: sulfotransferase [bacterium]|nr:sulfotransferase [Deltaproteobacteria bacterium]MCP4906965.1 sulfotransferase [bacterium]
MSSGYDENQAAFDEARLISDAQSSSGLSDFGADEFRRPLAVLLKSLREEAPLNEFGRTLMRSRILESLETRLKTQDWVVRHPEILEEEIVAPLVVIGLMRTGTTMLQRIIASDPRNHACMWWETRFPAPHPDTDWSQPDPRIPIAEAEVAAILAADPRQASIHPWDANAPDEEIMLLEHSFRSHVPEAFVNIPTYRSWINEEDWTPSYLYLKKLLQSLQWQKRQRGNIRERWVLKTPGHLGYIDTLFEVFPGANVIQTHRDPIDTVPSAASMNHAMWALYSDDFAANVAGAQWQERLAWGTARSMESRERYAEDRFVDIWFRDAMKDPIAEIERAYDVFGIEMTDAARAGMEKWRVDNPRDGRPPHKYTLSEYGLTEDGIKAAFAAYREQYIELRIEA